MSKRGRKPGVRDQKTKDLQQEIRKLKGLGMTYAEVGAAAGKHPKYVQRILSDQPKISGRCICCGRDCECLHRHHTDYLNDKVSNVCPTCHRSLHGKTAQDRLLEVEANSKLGLALSGLRLRAGWSLRRMAAEMGVSHSFLSQLENGQRRWHTRTNWEIVYRGIMAISGKL